MVTVQTPSSTTDPRAGRSNRGVASGIVFGLQPLVERDEQLEMLHALMTEPVSTGSVALISGEAGFGKTSLLRTFIAGLDHRYRILEAACEPVGVPTAFAPLFDLLDAFPDELRGDVRAGSGRPAVYAGMLDLLKSDRVVLTIEDLQWADEATLGLVRYLGRRIGPTRSCLVVTFRNEELDLTHPLHLVTADLALVGTRIDLQPLSLKGVEELTKGLDLDPVEIHAATLGNPFLVEEVVSHPGSTLPATIANAVMVRAARLSPDALEVLYQVALSPDGLPLTLLTKLNPEAGSYVDLAVRRRLLDSVNGQVTCRHALIRDSLEQAVPPALKMDLHRRLLELLEETADDSPDIARLAYHAVGAGDGDKVVDYSLRAARDASRGGAHRQAAVHYANALEYQSKMPEKVLEDTLLEAAMEHCLVNLFQEACDLADQRVEMMDTKLDEARARAWLAYFESRENDLPACRREADLAIEVLQGEPPSEELALAHAVLSWVLAVEGDASASIEHGEEAAAVARAAGSPRVEVHANTTVGMCRHWLGDPVGRARIEDAIRLGRESGADEWTARAYNNLGMTHLGSLELGRAAEYFEELVDFTTSRELEAWYIAAVSALSSIHLATGRWEEVDQALSLVLGQRTCISTEVESLIVAATLALRRGDPDSGEMIERILDRIEGSRDHEIAVGGAALAMEGAWVGVVDPQIAGGRYTAMLGSPGLADDNWGREMLAFWARRLDLEPPQGEIPEPAGLEWEGRISDAADEWERLGYVVEAAITRSLVPSTDLTSVFSTLSELGADGSARGLRRELQRRGVKGIPRGTRDSTRENPARLTARQAEVLELMTRGLSNAAIADKLYITEKTAGHHVSAILAKMNATSRLEAVAMANSNGWAG
jgi:DNA-binding CsgD family transcriptional regulator/tetratricopeptide (TPR) repeat protein